MFRIGDKVVCIDNRAKSPRLDEDEIILPEVGKTYTVRAIVPAARYGYDEVGLRLVEIVNPVDDYLSRAHRPIRCEVAFRASRFRPLAAANIAVFHKIRRTAEFHHKMQEVVDRLNAKFAQKKQK